MSTLNVATVKSLNTLPPAVQNSSGTEIGTFCRAWVNFNGTGTVAIRASFNVSSITDNGTGDYTVNFSTAMADANYSIVATGYFPSGSFGFFTNNNASYLTASSARIETVTHTGATASTDFSFSCVAVFR